MTNPNDDRLLEVLREVLSRASGEQMAPVSIEPEMTIKGLGIDSLKFIMVMLEIEQRIGRRVFNAENIGAMETVDDMWTLMAKDATPAKEQR
jgi:acyl carrier protein